jgi:hypothetical protein
MIKTILVPASGSATDDPVFATALAAARPLAAHLEFYHVHLSATEAAVRAPHVDFCVGAALPLALNASAKWNPTCLKSPRLTSNRSAAGTQ